MVGRAKIQGENFVFFLRKNPDSLAKAHLTVSSFMIFLFSLYEREKN